MNKKSIISISFILLIVFIIIIIRPRVNKPQNISGVYFDTLVDIKFYNKIDKKTKNSIINLLEKYDKALSPFNKSSEIYKINNSKGKITTSKDTLELIEYSVSYAKKYSNLFNPCLFELSNLWKNSSILPSSDAIKEKLKYTNYENLIIDKDNNSITKIDPNIKLDLGGIAKGYIAEKIKEILINNNIHNVLINLGGNILTVDGLDNSNDFKIGINNPNSNEPFVIIKSKNMSIVSSGQYERYNTINNIKYGHIINPISGIPVDNELMQVSIISNNSTTCDVLSTVCYILGTEKGTSLINSMPNVYAVFLNKNGKATYSDNFNELNIINKN